MKWSDGVDFTADDIAFYIEDVLYDPDLSPGGASADWIPTGQAEDMKFEKIDDYTFRLTFPKPYGTFLYVLAQWQGRQFAMYPKHYLQQFHAKYNENVDDLVEADSTVGDWMALFNKYGGDGWGNPGTFYLYPEHPTLYPWMTTQPLGTGTQVMMERNPYYWKVDTSGNQLPYIDTILATSYQDAESRTFAMLNGDIDAVKDPGNDNRIIYHDAMDEGKPISIYYPLSDGANTNTVHFNQTIADEDKAAVFADINFRIGMSLAINRAEIIEIVHNGQGTPAQQAPNNDGPLFTEGMDTQYVEYDPEQATQYLDKVFTNGKGADGYYLGADGKRFEMVFTVQNDLSFGTTYVQVAELLIGYWDKVGVKALLNSIAGDPYEVALTDNTIECIIFTAEGGAGITPILDPRYYVPLHGYQAYFGRGWYAWRVDDSEDVQVEPPQWAKDAYAKYEEVLMQPTQEQQIEKMMVVLEEAKENFYVIGISRPGTLYYPYHSRLGGIPDTWYDGWAEGVEKITYPEQWFIKE
jgi:peptide/nickel transport system substrate-binding protein